MGGFKSEQAVAIGGEALAVAAVEAQGEYISDVQSKCGVRSNQAVGALGENELQSVEG